MYIFNKHKRHEVQKAIAAKCSLVFIHLYIFKWFPQSKACLKIIFCYDIYFRDLNVTLLNFNITVRQLWLESFIRHELSFLKHQNFASGFFCDTVYLHPLFSFINCSYWGIDFFRFGSLGLATHTIISFPLNVNGKGHLKQNDLNSTTKLW